MLGPCTRGLVLKVQDPVSGPENKSYGMSSFLFCPEQDKRPICSSLGTVPVLCYSPNYVLHMSGRMLVVMGPNYWPRLTAEESG